MRVLGTVTVAVVLILLLLASLAAVVPGGGGIDPRVPEGTYIEKKQRPVVSFRNGTIEAGNPSTLDIKIWHVNGEYSEAVTVTLEIHRWGMYGEERELDQLDGPLPKFRFLDPEENDTVEGLKVQSSLDGIGSTEKPVANTVVVPDDAPQGYYRVRVQLDMGGTKAFSRGHFSEDEWEESLRDVSENKDPVRGKHLISEGGFTVVPIGFENVSRPNRVPDFGNFTTPVIRPGEKGTYNFTVTNRYESEMEDVTVTVEFYMWATIEESRTIEDLDAPVPKVVSTGGPGYSEGFAHIAPGASKPVVLEIATGDDTVKGTYFVRHEIRFTYEGEEFVMRSRGHFSRDQWEGFDYTNLHYQLGVAGIVPDSSFSVKDPVPLWPLATLIALCVVLGALAVVFYLAEEHGDQYPRLKRGLQHWSGRWEQRKRLMRQRLEDVRARQEGEDGRSLEDEDGDN